MDDSDQDFTNLCSRVLKRVRRKAKGVSEDEKPTYPPKRRKKTKEDLNVDQKPKLPSKYQADEASQGGSGSKNVTDVIRRMQKFKRASPERLLLQERAKESEENIPAPVTLQHTDVSGDEALALLLQQELDREVHAAGVVDDGGLFFCQLCQKDLSSMSPSLRTQHINRCLDACETSVPSTSHSSPRRPRVPECPICGKSFKTEKSRSAHLQRCSAVLGVKPNDLLEALRRQASETERESTREQTVQVVSSPRKHGVPVKKRSKKKAQKLDEDTMMALALSRSLLEQEKEKEREILAQLSSPPGVTAPVLQWKPGAGKGRGKRKKGVVLEQPQLLLIQDHQTALNRLQERVSSLLLSSRPSSPPTPTMSPSVLPLKPHGRLWDRSALHGGGSTSILEFYTSELSNFIQPWVAPEVKSCELVSQTPAVTSERFLLPDKCSGENQTPRPLTPCPDTPGTQALQDLMELAEEGMTLTQYGYATCTPAAKKSGEENEVSKVPLSPSAQETSQKRTKTTSVFVSKLASDLGSMVNNPQLSDVQLQVDTGDIFFTHSFMLYARCPLLANMVHELGFGVQEEGLTAARQVLLGDVSREAVLALLEYIYTAHCPLTNVLVPQMLQLADRFSLAELQQLCEEYSARTRDESDGILPGPSFGEQEENFLELLQSMWLHEDSEEEDNFIKDAGEHRNIEGEREGGDEHVDEEELDEIYEFAATQRKMETESEEEEANISTGNEMEVEKNQDYLEKLGSTCQSSIEGVDGRQATVVTSPTESQKDHGLEIETVNPYTNDIKGVETSLDGSYDHLFSQSIGEYTEPTQTPAACSLQQHHKSSDMGHQKEPATFRNLCISDVIDLSVSPPLSFGASGDPLFPMAGMSPVSHTGEITPSKTDIFISQRTHGSSSPAKSKSKEVELIVLSDDSEVEMGVHGDYSFPTTKCHSNPESPLMSTSHVHQVKLAENILKESGPLDHAEKQVDVSKQKVSDEETNSKHSEHCRTANEIVFDGSAEVSWLIPATPVPATRSSSAQTCISMRRTQLFPKSSSPTSSSSLSRLKPVTSASSSSNCLEEKLVPLSHRLNDTDQSPVYERPHHHLRLSQLASNDFHTGSIMGRPLQGVPGPSSSTPLHSQHSLQRQINCDSSINADCQDRSGDLRTFGSEEKVDQLSLQLSSSHHSKSPEKTPSGSLPFGSFRQSMNSYTQTDKARESDKDGKEKKPEAKESPIQRVAEVVDTVGNAFCEEEVKGSPIVDEVVDTVVNLLCELDEPPIAFDDSWGLDGGGVGHRPCFSLRLDSSEGTLSPQALQVKGQAVDPLTTQNQTPSTSPAPLNHSLPDADNWDFWEEEENVLLPLSQRLVAPSAKRVAELKTPVACRNKNNGPLVPITPMPGFSDMDTPELKNRLDRFGVRPLPKKQMVLKLKEIHQYTHQLQSSDSDEDHTSVSKLPPKNIFKLPEAPPTVSPLKLPPSESDEPLSASQNSNTSSTPESERSNPEMCCSEDDDSDSEGVSASQAVVKEKDKLAAVRRFILSDPELYGRVLQYKPLPLAELRSQLRAAGIRLAAAKLLDFLDSQCITFSTAKQGASASSRRKRVKTPTNGKGAGRGRKKIARPNGGIVTSNNMVK